MYRGRIPLEPVIRSLHFTCKTEPFRNGPDETRTRVLRHARAPSWFSKGFQSLQNCWKSPHFCVGVFPSISGDLLGLLHSRCSVNAKLAKGAWESLRNSLMPELCQGLPSG